jgi:hypothetical protein
MTDIVTYCDINNCTECPRYGDDCDGDKRVEHTDLISRADAIEAVKFLPPYREYWKGTRKVLYTKEDIIKALNALPSAEAEEHRIYQAGYKTGKLHARDYKWIPCSERLPKAEDMYQPPEQRYLCQLEAYGERKFCVLSRLKGAVSPFWDWYGIAVYDSEVTAWMPLPTPYKGGDDE